MEVKIRRATRGDLDAIGELAPRLHEFGPPPFRPIDRMNEAVIAGLREGIEDPPEGSELFVADEGGRIAGFMYLVTTSDFYTKEKHGHVSDLVVAREGEGRGVGRALLAAGEEWARERGYRLLSLKVFGDNERARRLYERIGYATDTIKMVKSLAS